MSASVSAPDKARAGTPIVSDGSATSSANRTARSHEPTVKQIIAAARSQPAKARGGLLLAGISAILLWASFTPLDWSPLAWIALAPLSVMIRLDRAPRRWWLTTFVGGLAFWLPTLQWLRLGDPSMYVAWFALATYLAVYWPLFVGLSRAAVSRCGMPMTVSAPLVWVGLEFVRAHLMTGFAWYFLGHTQYRWTAIIQLSDVFGAYGVSFVVAMSSAVLAGLIPIAWLSRIKLLPPIQLPSELRHLPPPDETDPAAERIRFHRQLASVAALLVVVIAAVSYGIVRRGHAEFKAGPRVALIQGNFPSSLKHDPAEFGQIYRIHDLLTGYSVPHKPDVIVWPETMFRWPLLDADPGLSEADLTRIAPSIPSNLWRDPVVSQTIAEMSQKAGAAVVLGIDRFQAMPGRLRHFNSAVWATPHRGVAGTYDKMHRVIFGEYVPLRESLPWLASFSPIPDELGLTAGTHAVSFNSKHGPMLPVICFEDTVPHLVRDVVHSSWNGQATGNNLPDQSRPACLLNLTNDGWFHGSSELDQHLITSLFRAVECRTPLVRAVNTGISAVIDGDGVIREPEVFINGDATWAATRDTLQKAGRSRSAERVPVSMFDPVRSTLFDPVTGRCRKSLNAAVIDTVPLDNRRSLYVTYGDWFAGTCSAACGLFLIVGLIPRRSRTETI